jgi:hypothetical protein
MNVIIVVMLTVLVMGVVVVSRRNATKRQGDVYWVVNPNQQGRRSAYMGHGKPRPEGSYRIPLRVTEAPDEFSATSKREQKTRYFERD